MIRKFITLAIIGFVSLQVMAQSPVEGLTYYLPQTIVKVRVQVEHKRFQPGRLAVYGQKYLRQACGMEQQDSYRICGANMYADALPDTARHFDVTLDRKKSIFTIECDENGVLMAVNDKGTKATPPAAFKPSRQVPPLNPDNFMTADMLAAGSNSKLAELVAQEIFDIRDARNQINRGESDQMPKDGEQLRLMLEGLDQQETALMQLFQGVTTVDTTETEFTFIPTTDKPRTLLFRFSKRLGLVDTDDLGGAPYYMNVEKLNDVKMPDVPQTDKKKEEPALFVAVPAKIRLTLNDDQQKKLCGLELYAAQFGDIYGISEELFSKKQITHILLNPLTGAVEHLEVEPVK
ncbi:MAG: DUF4831 family protein [Prevotella sp.]|jgi:hypothetical protein